MTVDLDALRDEAQDAARRLLRRAGSIPGRAGRYADRSWSDHQTDARFASDSSAHTAKDAMAYPNTLIFVDFPSTDPEATAQFYAEVFGWQVEGRPAGAFHRIVPGQHFMLPDSDQQSTIGNLHMGIYDVKDGRPNPKGGAGYPDTDLPRGRGPRVYILISDDDNQDRILDGRRVSGRHDLVAQSLLG